MSDEVKLEPCPTPWCDERGGEPYVFERRFDCLGVYCPTCRVSTPYFTSQQQAIECWNTRPTTAPPCPELVERVARAIREKLKELNADPPYHGNQLAIAAIEATRPTRTFQVTRRASLMEKLESKNSNGFMELPSYRNPDGLEAAAALREDDALIRELVEALTKIKQLKAQPIGSTGFATGPLSLLKQAQRIAEAATLKAKASQ